MRPSDFRQDIEGLRGIAVGLVLLFHFSVPYCTGGFIGVDVFFVISGYLITKIVQDEIRSDSFSFPKFYGRRVRRIVPNLLVVCAFSALVSAMILPFLEFRAFGRDLLTTIFMVSNAGFYKFAPEYSAPAAEFNPLLMTWSLGIEEQFYLIWPVLLVGVHRIWKARLREILVAFTLGSFFISVMLLSANAKAAFYLPHSRAWECAAGGLLALYGSPFRQHRQRLCTIVAAMALATLIVGMFCYGPATKFPGVAALLPVLSTLILIAVGDQNAVSKRVISSRPLLALGKMSYSLYLWHWPILAFQKQMTHSPETFVPMQSLTGLVCTFVFAYLAWKLVEVPLRKPTVSIKRIVVSCAAAAGVLSTIGIVVFVNWGFPKRAFNERLAVRNSVGEHACHEMPDRGLYSKKVIRCSSDQSDTQKILVYGDSHAAAMFPGLAELASKMGESVALANLYGCNLFPSLNSADSLCQNFKAFLNEVPVSLPNTETVVIGNYWHAVRVLLERTHGNAWRTIFRSELEKAVRLLNDRGVKVVLLSQVPTFPFDAGICNTPLLPQNWLSNLPWSNCTASLSEVSASMQEENQILEELVRDVPGTCIARIHSAICDDNFCYSRIGDKKLYKDTNHLTMSGSRLASKELEISSCLPARKDG